MGDEGEILYAVHGGVYVFKFVGTMRSVVLGGHGPVQCLDAFLTRILESGNFDSIVFDLRETESIDSTHLGLIAKAGAFMLTERNEKLTVVSTNARVNDVLRVMGLDQLFTLMDFLPEWEEDLEALPDTETKEPLAKVVLEAHQVLAALSDENRERFKSVIDVLNRQVTDDS